MDYDEVERRRRAAAPNTIPKTPSEERLETQAKLPNLDPLKVESASPAYAGGYNPQSAANARVTSPEALAPRVVSQKKAALQLNPFEWRDDRQAARRRMEAARQRVQAGQGSREDWELVFGPGTPYENYRPSVTNPSDQANYTNVTDTGVVNNPELSIARRTGIGLSARNIMPAAGVTAPPEQAPPANPDARPPNSVNIDGVDFDAGRLPADAPPGVKAGDTVIAGTTNADRDGYRSAITEAGEQEKLLSKQAAYEEARSLKRAAAQSAARRGAAGAGGPNRQLDSMVAAQLAQRQAAIEAERARQLDQLEREFKAAELEGRARADQMNLARMSYEASRPRSFADQAYQALPQLAGAVANPLLSAYIGQTGLFAPKPSIPEKKENLVEDNYYSQRALADRFFRGVPY